MNPSPQPYGTLLTPLEEAVLPIIRRHACERVARSQRCDLMQASTLVDEQIAQIGEKRYIGLFTEPTEVLGIPYQAFIVIALVGLLLFAYTQELVIIFILIPIVHLVIYLWYTKAKQTIVLRRMEKIRRDGKVS